MNDYFANELDKRKEFLERIVREKSAAIAAGGPSGRLRCVSRNGRSEYYWRSSPKSISGTYIHADNRDFAVALAQHSYDQMVLSYAQEELRCIEQLAKKRQFHCVEKVYESYGLPRRALVDPVWQPDDEFVATWLSAKYKPLSFKPGEPEFYTKRDERMRSKTEVMISDILTDLCVPYFYEMPLNLGQYGWAFPDFTVLNVRLRLVYYWEHLGMMGDPEYCERNLEKILKYERAGIYPGTNLIITHETNLRPVDTRILRMTAEHYLL